MRVPQGADKATIAADGSLEIPDKLIVPYIQGDGIGIDVTPVMLRVVDSAVQKAYAGKRKIAWMEIIVIFSIRIMFVRAELFLLPAVQVFISLLQRARSLFSPSPLWGWE